MTSLSASDPAMREVAHRHENLFAEEEHFELRIVGDFAQDVCGGEGELGAPEEVLPDGLKED